MESYCLIASQYLQMQKSIRNDATKEGSSLNASSYHTLFLRSKYLISHHGPTSSLKQTGAAYVSFIMLSKSQNHLPTMMALQADERKQHGMDKYSIPCELKSLAKTTSQSTNNSCNYCISMENSLPFRIPRDLFLFCQFSSGSFSGPGGGTQARNWPMLSSKRFDEREGLHSPCFNGRLSVAMQGFGIIWGTPIKWCCTF